tara:strand:- start:495 stop:725 length:231 start_codon:yes stop_codon:yes gene_type:complete
MEHSSHTILNGITNLVENKSSLNESQSHIMPNGKVMSGSVHKKKSENSMESSQKNAPNKKNNKKKKVNKTKSTNQY